MPRKTTILVGLMTLIALPATGQSRLSPALIVEHGTTAGPRSTWTVGDTMLLVGDVDGESATAFWDIAGIVVLQDTLVVVGDGGTSELRAFHRHSGDLLFVSGGEGQGPGEITRLWNLWEAGDRIAARDAGARLSFFDAFGRFLEQTPPRITPAGTPLETVGWFSERVQLAFAVEPAERLPVGSSTISMAILRVEGDESQTIATYPMGMVTSTGTGGARSLGYGPTTVAAVFADRFCLGFPLRYEIDCMSPAGDALLRIERGRWPRQRVTADDREAVFRSAEDANQGNPRLTAYLESLRENQRFAEEHPAFVRMLPGGSAELWVAQYVRPMSASRRYPTPATPSHWSVYSADDGSWLADVTLPPRFYLMAVGDTYLVGTLRGDYDVESVAVLSLRK